MSLSERWRMTTESFTLVAGLFTLYSLYPCYPPPSFLSLQGQPKVSRKHLSTLNIDNVVIRLLMASILPVACSAFCQINKCVKLHYLSHCHFNTSHFLINTPLQIPGRQVSIEEDDVSKWASFLEDDACLFALCLS